MIKTLKIKYLMIFLLDWNKKNQRIGLITMNVDLRPFDVRTLLKMAQDLNVTERSKSNEYTKAELIRLIKDYYAKNEKKGERKIKMGERFIIDLPDAVKAGLLKNSKCPYKASEVDFEIHIQGKK